MNRIVLVVLLASALTITHAAQRTPAVPPAAAPLATMRLDYYHTGNDKEERFSLDRVVVEPLPWAGNPSKRIDDTNRGKYFFEVIDSATSRVLFSRGFASIYGEWETTGEAQKMNRTFSESLRFPAIDKPARIVLKKRDPRNVFRGFYETTCGPDELIGSIMRRGPASGSGCA